MKLRKVLIPVPGLDLSLPLGTMNAVWQFLKGMYESGIEPIVLPYLGKPISSIWWKSYGNPCRFESEVYLKLFELRKGLSSNKKSSLDNTLVPKMARALIKPKWKKALANILDKEGDIDAVLFWGLPLNHLVGIPTFIKQRYGIPVLYFDADMPFSLPRFGGFTFNYYPGADLTEYDAILGNSEAVLPEILDMGAHEVHAVHFAVDPDVFHPVEVEKQKIDVFFSAWGERDRAQWIENYITIPSKSTSYKFRIAGGGFTMDLGRAKVIPFQPIPRLRYLICSSKVNLSITRQCVTENMASNSRPFELGALGACTISNPNQLIEKLFTVGEEIFIAHDSDEALKLYKWLVDDEETRMKTGMKARERVMKSHTFRHRAQQIVKIIENLARRS